jgi:fumarylpyruvate hydrolase
LSFVVAPQPTTEITVVGSSDTFPVHRVYCVGKNYADHVKEMGSTPDRDPPCFFMKPADAVITDSEVPYPPGTKNYHYETELVLAIGKEGRNISEADASNYIFGYAVGFDMTRRDLQMGAGGIGHPWDTGKGFDHSAPISSIYSAADVGHINQGRISMAVNGETRQDADIGQLIWKNNEIIAQLSRLFLLKPGDLIYTGTPAGVGAVVPGDKLVAAVDGLGELAIEITSPE